MMIRGVSLYRERLSDPSNVKKTFFDIYCNKFQLFDGVPMSRQSERYRSIDPELASCNESMFTPK